MRNATSVEGLYCKRPIQRLSSSEILTPHPLTVRRVCAGGGHTRWVERGLGSIDRKMPDTALYSIYVSTLWQYGLNLFGPLTYKAALPKYSGRIRVKPHTVKIQRTRGYQMIQRGPGFLALVYDRKKAWSYMKYLILSAQDCVAFCCILFILPGEGLGVESVCERHRWCSLRCDYLRKFFENILNGLNGIPKGLAETDS